jgi:hypothetical protein
MKALKSKLASQVLSDPKGKEVLRTYLANKGEQTTARDTKSGRFIEVRSSKGEVVRMRPGIVPKAA